MGCDPLAPDATPHVIIITPTPKPTSVPLASTATPTIPVTDTVEGAGSGVITATSSANIGGTDNANTTASTKPAICTEGKGQVVDLSFASKIVGDAVPYRVYLPPCYYDTTRRYPYVILMPGSDKDEKEWTDLLKADQVLESGIAMQVLPPMLLIMPNGGDLMNTNVFLESASWESLLLKELMPEIEKNFCTWNAREGRAIGGISRGGFWAYEIGLRHPDLFSAIGGHSAYFDMQNAPAAYNPMSLAKTVQFAPGTQPRMYLDVAKDDVIRTNLEIFQKTLANRNIDAGYVANPSGGHEVTYWASHVTEYLTFYGQTWPRDVKELPSCLQ